MLTSYKYRLSDYFNGTLRFDVRTKRGLAGGIDSYYNTKFLGKGIVKAYYADDKQKHLGKEERKQIDRYRVLLRHRWNIDKSTTLIGEAHKVKDKKMIKDFFYREEYERDNRQCYHKNYRQRYFP